MSSLLNALEDDRINDAIRLIQSGVDLNAQNPINKETALHVAVRKFKDEKYLNVIQLLLEYGADVMLENCYGVSTLRYVMEWGTIHLAVFFQNGKYEKFWNHSVQTKDRELALKLVRFKRDGVAKFIAIFGDNRICVGRKIQEIRDFFYDKTNYGYDPVIVDKMNNGFQVLKCSECGYLMEDNLFLVSTPRKYVLIASFDGKQHQASFTMMSNVYNFLETCQFEQIEDCYNKFPYNEGYNKAGYYLYVENLTCCYHVKLFRVVTDRKGISFKDTWVECRYKNLCRNRFYNWYNVKRNVTTVQCYKAVVNTVLICCRCNNMHYFFLECNCWRFNSEEEGDVKLRIGDQTFHCHRHILAKNSDYFEAAFSRFQMQKIYTIAEFPEEFLFLLHYIYFRRKFAENVDFESTSFKECALYYAVSIISPINEELNCDHKKLKE